MVYDFYPPKIDNIFVIHTILSQVKIIKFSFPNPPQQLKGRLGPWTPENLEGSIPKPIPPSIVRYKMTYVEAWQAGHLGP